MSGPSSFQGDGSHVHIRVGGDVDGDGVSGVLGKFLTLVSVALVALTFPFSMVVVIKQVQVGFCSSDFY